MTKKRKKRRLAPGPVPSPDSQWRSWSLSWIAALALAGLMIKREQAGGVWRAASCSLPCFRNTLLSLSLSPSHIAAPSSQRVVVGLVVGAQQQPLHYAVSHSSSSPFASACCFPFPHRLGTVLGSALRGSSAAGWMKCLVAAPSSSAWYASLLPSPTEHGQTPVSLAVRGNPGGFAV